MQLRETENPVVVQLSGEASDVVIEAGQRLKIETSPSGAEILNVEVPAGEHWTVGICVEVRVANV